MDDFGEVMLGIFITLLIMGGVYIYWGGPKQTTSGEWYIRTHWSNYKLVSDKPFKLDIKSSLVEDKE